MRHFRGDGHDHRMVGRGCLIAIALALLALVVLGAAAGVVVNVFRLVTGL